RQRPGVDGTGKDLTLLLTSGDAALDVATVAILSIIGGLYVLANFGERNTTARMITLIVGGGLSAIALLAGLLVALNNMAQYAVGAVRPEQFRTNELVGIPLTIAGAVGLLYLWPPIQRAVARA